MYIIPGCKSSGRRLTGRKKYGSVFCFDPGAPNDPFDRVDFSASRLSAHDSRTHLGFPPFIRTWTIGCRSHKARTNRNPFLVWPADERTSSFFLHGWNEGRILGPFPKSVWAVTVVCVQTMLIIDLRQQQGSLLLSKTKTRSVPQTEQEKKASFSRKMSGAWSQNKMAY